MSAMFRSRVKARVEPKVFIRNRESICKNNAGDSKDKDGERGKALNFAKNINDKIEEI